jgi:hypothetical protein
MVCRDGFSVLSICLAHGVSRAGLSVVVVVVLIVAVAAFTWRAFSSNTPFGWV